MTTPTSFTFKGRILNTDSVTFLSGIELSTLQIQSSSVNLVDKIINDFILPDGAVGYLQGSYVEATKVFTVGAGDRVLFWNAPASEFTSTDKNGGNWALAA